MDYFVSMHQDHYELGLSNKNDGGSITPITERIILNDTTDENGTFVDSVVSSRRYPILSCVICPSPTMKVSPRMKDHHCDNVIDLDGDGKCMVFIIDSGWIILSRAILKIKATWTFLLLQEG